MSDAATRLSRYFLSQVLINAAYGVFIGLALWAIGMPSPVAWGILAMLMRFVPYVGSYIAAAVAGADRRGHRSRLDYRAPGHRTVRRRRDDHGPGGRAASIRPRHRRHAHRRDRLHHLLDVAVGPPRAPDRHAHHRLPQRARPPCRGLALPQRAARRPAGADAGGELLSARADRRRGGGHLSGRARPEGREPHVISRPGGARRSEAGRARCSARRAERRPDRRASP